jgi:hypothetical protein
MMQNASLNWLLNIQKLHEIYFSTYVRKGPRSLMSKCTVFTSTASYKTEDSQRLA